MHRNFGSYLRETFGQAPGLVWNLVGAVASVVALLASSGNLLPRLIFAVFILVLALFARLLSKGYEFYKGIGRRLGIRTIMPSAPYYGKTLLFVLDKANWFSQDLLLVLYVQRGDAEIPIAVLRVEGFTGENYPQAVLLEYFGEGDSKQYLTDSTRWKSLFVNCLVSEKHLKGKTNG